MYSIWSGVDTLAALEELAQDFVDQTAFMEYFKASWVPKIGMISLSLSLSPWDTYLHTHNLDKRQMCEISLECLYLSFACFLFDRNVAFNYQNSSSS